MGDCFQIARLRIQGQIGQRLGPGVTRPVLLVLVLISLNGLSCTRSVFGQAAVTPEAVDSGSPDTRGFATVQASPADRIVEDPIDAAAPNLMRRIDGWFNRAVVEMQRVLFYRLGQTEQTYVQVDEKQWFARDRGTDTPFSRIDGADLGQQLTSADAVRMEVLGRLVPDVGGNVIRKGHLEGRPIEYLVVQKASARYVLRDGLYRRQLPLRELLSDDDVMTEADVLAAASAGRLVTDDTLLGNNYQLKESVGGIPLVVLWLAVGAVFFTFYMRFVIFWAFRHAIEVVRGKYDNPDEPGEVTHFQALASALSATVGLGNIAGVTIAMQAGGPGAFFWMMACGFFGMTSKFVECTLGQRYRRVKEDGTVLGGPMQYLSQGLAELGLKPLGIVLAFLFAVMCILASFGGGNMFQANQSGQQMLTMFQMADYEQLESLDLQIRTAAAEGDDVGLAELRAVRATLRTDMDGFEQKFLPVFGVVLALFVGAVIIGGIKRIGAAASRIVPTMCVVYVGACAWIILNHLGQVPALVSSIFTEAFRPEAFGGGLLGVLVLGVQRAAFSNEAGVGSASIAHSAAKTEEPVREGIVALMGPFIDTIVVCSMTALVILITGAWDNHAWVIDQGLQGTPLTSKAFEQEISFFPYVLSVAVLLFAYSTIISWSYYGERCWERLFGPRSVIVYRLIYVFAVFFGAVINLGAVLDFSDMMILSMAFPNVAGLLLLSPRVRRDLSDYWQRLTAGEFRTFQK